MRKAMFLFALSLAGCGATPVAPVTPGTPTSSLRGSIGKQPFVARAALVTHVNSMRRMSGPCSEQELDEAKQRSDWFKNHPEAWDTCKSSRTGPDVLVTELYVFERVATCADFRDNRRPIAQNERAIEADLYGVWPPAAHTTLRAGEDRGKGTSPHATASYADYRSSDGNGGYSAYGTITVVEATAEDGLLAIDLAASDGDATTRGTVHVTVCP